MPFDEVEQVLPRLPARIEHALQANGISRELVEEMTDVEILKICGIGPKGLKEIRITQGRICPTCGRSR